MKLVFIIILSIATSFVCASNEDLARAANENPFLNGELNPKYEGQKTALAGEILEIKSTTQNFPIYKLNTRLKGINAVWVTSIAPAPSGGIKVGDMLIFKGFITTSAGLDSTGKLETLIQGKTLLMAIQAQRAN